MKKPEIIITSYDRDKLYREVWCEPVTTVAKQYGVSDVAIHKACKRLQVPVPPRGYWAKLAAGRSVERAPLPPYDGPKIVPSFASRRETSPLTKAREVKERLAFLSEQERTTFLDRCDNLQVSDRLTNPHPLIVQDRDVRAEHKRKMKERDSPGYWMRDRSSDGDFWSTWYKKVLDIRVEPEDMQRAYRLMNAIIRAVEDLGGKIAVNDKGHTTARWLGEEMRIRLKSKEHEFALVIDDYHAPRKNWRDTKRKRLESESGSFVIGLLECAHALRTLREERRREEQLRWQRERERLERAQRQKGELERFQALEENALDWQKARVIEQYVAELENQASNETDDRKRHRLLHYIAWAKEKIAWLDPLIAREDPILGRRCDDSDEEYEEENR